jgi:hypothetical protein
MGGRARGRQRPRAPSLAERPDGSHRRLPSLGGSPGPVIEEEEEEETDDEKSGARAIDDGRRQAGMGQLRRRQEVPDGIIQS